LFRTRDIRSLRCSLVMMSGMTPSDDASIISFTARLESATTITLQGPNALQRR